ncbi:TPA: EamA family transporter [Candidatus Sumerlaeota bacterium]|jgi:bacterial/archaeal transporter family protein|nr:EamA family transporter [Candidatus Sumerlaeota bacterium]
MLSSHLWLIFAFLSALTAGFVAIFGKMGLQTLDANAATAVRSFIMSLFLLLVVAAQGNLHKIPGIIAQRRGLLFIALSGIAGALSWLFYFLALKHGKVSQVAPVDKLSVVLAATLAVLFLGETIGKMNILGLALITIGVVIVAVS